MQRFRGVPVEVQNYIDDTGVQVADVVVGFRELENKTLEDIRAIADSTRFDYYCWDLYARVTQWYDEDKERLKIRAATLHDIEHGGTATSDIAAFIAERIVRCHLKTMARLNVDYDLLTWEGHILRLQFWARAFEILKEKGAVYLQTEGKLAGCWVMKIEDEPAAEVIGDSAASAEGSGEPRRSAHEADAQRRGLGISENEESEREKVIVRSNGTVTYVGKDIAYQFWKLGLLGRDFYYCRFGTRTNGERPVVDFPDTRGCFASAIRPRRRDLQRHRCAAVVSSEASEAGASDPRLRRAGRAGNALLVRNGGALERRGAGARIPRRPMRPMTSAGSSMCRAARDRG